MRRIKWFRGTADKQIHVLGDGCRPSGRALFRKGDTAMAANRTLYVNCNPATLIRDEQALIRAGYDVDSVFGADGLLACESVAEYASVLIDDACPLWRREKMIFWLR